MDEPWKCPRCSFTNEYYAAYCISCSEPRPQGSSDLSDDELSDRADVEERKSIASATTLREGIAHSVPRPDQRTSPAPAPKRRRAYGKPTDKKANKRSLVTGSMVAFVGIIVAIVLLVGWANSSSEAESNRAYLDAFESVNSLRSEVIELANSRFDVWMTTEDETPGAEYLVAEELADLQLAAEQMDPPESAELLVLHEDWLAAIRALAGAEATLAGDASVANFEVDTQAWVDEGETFSPLFDKSNDLL